MINILLVLCFASAVIAASNEDLEKWEKFKTKYGKVYPSKNEEEWRMKAFLMHKAQVDTINDKFARRKSTYKASIYSYHDLSTAEFEARYLGTWEPNNITNAHYANIIIKAQPGYVDLSLTPEVNGVRDQGDCGSAWAFAATASTESRYYRNSNKTKTIHLSEQQLVDCVYSNNSFRSGCNRGWITDAFDWIKINGQTKESNIPYTGRHGGNCTKPSADFLPNGWGKIPNGVDQLQTALNTYGVLSIAVDATNWGNYKAGVFTAEYMNNRMNHVANLVGYGRDTVSGTFYWKIRNCWGADWGENGYIRVPIFPSDGQYNTYNTIHTYAVL